MKTYLVYYREVTSSPMDEGFNFVCKGDDFAHAEEQALNAYPGIKIINIHLSDRPGDAIASVQS